MCSMREQVLARKKSGILDKVCGSMLAQTGPRQMEQSQIAQLKLSSVVQTAKFMQVVIRTGLAMESGDTTEQPGPTPVMLPPAD
jgi:hypothetical protein